MAIFVLFQSFDIINSLNYSTDGICKIEMKKKNFFLNFLMTSRKKVRFLKYLYKFVNETLQLFRQNNKGQIAERNTEIAYIITKIHSQRQGKREHDTNRKREGEGALEPVNLAFNVV